jgi:transposase InsO family protein
LYHSFTLQTFLNRVERQFGKIINRIYSDNGAEFITNELKNCFLMIGVIHEKIPLYSAESNGIAEYFNQTINMIVHTMSFAAPEFPAYGLLPLT